MLGFLKRVVSAPRPELYGLDHAVLNMPLPSPTMWMNLGYWESTTDFAEACQALLDQVLASSLWPDKAQSVRVVDVGCGCGDQSLYLASLARDASPSTKNPASASGSKATEAPSPAIRPRIPHASAPPLIDDYIGITVEPAQAAFAKKRLQSSHQGLQGATSRSSAKIFCADAADPTSWSGDLEASINDLIGTSQAPNTATWLLALDAVYHFRPSRLPILQYACSTLHASFMAFDLILADGASWWDRLLLRLVCWVTGAPFSNFISQGDYVQMLVTAGYDPSLVEMRDISGHVFSGLAGFLERRVSEARPFGLKMRKYSAAKRVFGWWARSGVVRGVVVVARRS
ncbi:uncharacterized protein N7459_009879 [Penicillium hispanicum]|uniref:uncharacterized protein n=1 Tax=Penicillium hispanicum TaxID=1080232 RepID=UPI00253FD9C2|nr:uncharacterized protein N7459_009879 [Penicillium hispanicum]KAJ5570449.1 hypothetical protein N7459_009879 [Penicillium hispanicum]